jgi:hypothetical protein
MYQRNVIYFIVSSGLLMVIPMLGFLGGVPTTLAQPAAQSTSALVSPTSTRAPDTLGSNNPDAQTQPLAPNAPKEVEAPQAGTNYLHISGSVFVPLYSSTTFAYSGSGCIYFTGGGNNFLQFPLELPYNSTITQLRLYYKDTNAGSNATLYLAQYDDGLGYTYIVTVTSSGSGGWGTNTVSLSQVPDYVNYSYTLLWVSPVADSSLQLCGFRVAYAPPPIFGAALPLITK